MSATKIIDTLLKGLVTGDGASIHVGTLEAPTDGYMVSRPDTERVLDSPGHGLLERDVARYVADHILIADRVGTVYFGAWRDGDKVYLDLSSRITDRERAKEWGRAWGQRAIYDVANDDTVYL